MTSPLTRCLFCARVNHDTCMSAAILRFAKYNPGCLQDLDFIELFAGSATLAQEAASKGYRAASLDIEKGRGMDILQPSGFARLISNMCMGPCFVQLLRMCAVSSLHTICHCSMPLSSRTFLASVLNGRSSGFVSWLAVVCSSWVDASRGSTKRSWVMPEGYDEFPSVHAGNLMVSRYPGCTKIPYVYGSHANRSPEAPNHLNRAQAPSFPYPVKYTSSSFQVAQPYKPVP